MSSVDESAVIVGELLFLVSQVVRMNNEYSNLVVLTRILFLFETRLSMNVTSTFEGGFSHLPEFYVNCTISLCDVLMCLELSVLTSCS